MALKLNFLDQLNKKPIEKCCSPSIKETTAILIPKIFSILCVCTCREDICLNLAYFLSIVLI